MNEGLSPPVFGVIQWPTWIGHEPSLAHGVELRPLKVCRVLILHVARVRLFGVWVHVVLKMRNSRFSSKAQILLLFSKYQDQSIQLLSVFPDMNQLHQP